MPCSIFCASWSRGVPILKLHQTLTIGHSDLRSLCLSMLCLKIGCFIPTFFEIAICIRSLLSSLVFKKTTLRKDIKDPKVRSTEGTGVEDDGQSPDDDQASRQAVINLIGVDSQRCSDFAASLYNYPSAVTRIAVSILLLVSILGWLPLVVGLLAFSLSLPFNVFLSKKFAKAHVKLMKARDSRLAVVNEALVGIRQVKLSGLVREWEQKIIEQRTRELGILMRVYLLDFGLVGCWIFSPIGFSAASLAAYSMVNGSSISKCRIYDHIDIHAGGCSTFSATGTDQ